MNYTVADLAKHLQTDFIGDGATLISGLSSLDEVASHHLVFADGEANIKRAFISEAAAVMLATPPEQTNKPVIVFPNPMMAFVELMDLFYPSPEPKKTIHSSAVIGDNVSIGEGASIGPQVVIEDNCVIGNNVVIHPQVVIRESCHIGNECEIHPQVCLYPNTILQDKVTIHAGSIIGSDGFGYKMFEGIHHKIPHVGRVIIESHVEIGANTVVDRATLGSTKIGKGSKIDNLVQIAHNVKLGEHNIICAFTGIAGSSQSGRHVVFAANVGVSDHVTIEDEVILGARAGVPPKKVLKKGLNYLGNPARPKDKAIEQEFSTTRIPFMRKHIQNLQDKVSALETQLEKLSSAD
ncbi:MAG: UDP-3-O-(3-hydroxymyristoyl)glucosamine N-acyltransferase [Gammaproteobacteria bacterium]|nr:UDP-3-O-(3-hydroxymyristoyl)glucosamine N-acyltransferase [Gammaproteobacteria bacterium]